MGIPTWAEVNFWVALAIIGMALFAFALVKGKKHEENYVTWMRNWEA